MRTNAFHEEALADHTVEEHKNKLLYKASGRLPSQI